MNTGSLPRSSPAAEGVDPGAIIRFVEALKDPKLGTHSLMILRHGQVIAEGWWAPYEAQRPHLLYSLSKSFTSTAAGFAIGEGVLSLDDRIIDLFPESVPAVVSDNLRSMRLRHALSMCTGHEVSALDGVVGVNDDWVRGILAMPVPFEPGTQFVYNNGATYLVSAAVQKRTGQTILDYLMPRLFEPLGIARPVWPTCPKGIVHGFSSLNVPTEAIAKLGQLYLQDGVWNGARLLPEGWVEDASSKHIDNGDDPTNDWNQGYGFQFWRCRHGAFRGDGAFGQYCVVLPDKDAVVAATSSNQDMGVTLNHLWEQLLPGFDAEPTAPDFSPLLSDLAVAAPGSAARPSGVMDASEYASEEGLTVSVSVTDEGACLQWDQKVAGGISEWQNFDFDFGNGPKEAAGRAGWRDDGSLGVTVVDRGTPDQITFWVRFDGEKIAIETERFGTFQESTPRKFEGRSTAH